MTTKWDKAELDAFLEQALAEIGTGDFSSLRLMELEALIRARYPARALPGKTVLRASINSFRTARWPATAPKQVYRRW